MGIIKKILEGRKLLAQTSHIPFVRISADRNSAEMLYNKGLYSLALGFFFNTRKAAHENGLFFDEVICLMREIEIRTDDNHSASTQDLYKQMREIENILDDNEAVLRLTHGYRYNIDSKNNDLTSVLNNVMKTYYDWFLSESKKTSSNLHYRESILCAKAARRLCELFDFLSYEQEIDALFSLGLLYGNIRSAGKAILYYNEALSIARKHSDIATEFVAIVRKLSILLAISHIDTYLDYDKERDSTIKDLLLLSGNLSFIDFYSQMIDEKNTRLNAHPDEQERIIGHINRLEEAVPNLELLLALKYGDMDVAEQCVEKVRTAEINLYGCPSHADSIIEFYQMLFNSPERELEKDETSEAEDPLYVPDIPDSMPLSFRFSELLKWTTNCTVNNWHKSAEDSAAVLFTMAAESGSDYHICMSLYMLAREHAHAGKINEALEEYNGTLSILSLNTDADESDANLSPYLYYVTHMSLGDLLIEKDPTEAIRHFDIALEYLGQENSSHLFLEIYIRTSRALALEKAGRISEAEQAFVFILGELTSSAIERLPYLTGDERESVWSDILRAIKRVISRLSNSSGEQFTIAAYNAILFSKGFLLTTEKSIQSIVSEAGYERALELYNLNIQDHSTIGTWGTPHSFNAEQYVDKYLNDARLQLLIKDALSANVAKPREDFRCIQTLLQKGEALVDFFDVNVGTPDVGNKYLAFIVKPERVQPLVIETCSEDSICNVFSMIKEKGLTEAALYASEEPYGQKLADCLWNPLLPFLDNCETIYFSPSGSLHRIAVECLPANGGTIAQQYHAFYRISHARKVPSFRNESLSDLGNTVIIGGLKYDDSQDCDIPSDETTKSRGYALNNNRSDDAPSRWSFLPWSEREVDAVNRIWQLKKTSVSSICKGLSADDNYFKSLSNGGPQILHIATHGFSMTRKAAQNIPALKGLHLPLDLTGLILSYGNSGWIKGDKIEHRGVVTATEIAQMNLANTELVVLSACFTGTGFIGQDGLYGLIRAFKIAGARTILASLWEADDEAAYYFMYNFYSAYLSQGVKYRDAFEYARRCTKEDYPDPVYWAGYILVD